MKKLITKLVSLMIISTIFLLSSCTPKQTFSTDEIAGTYKLTSYTAEIDYIKEKEIEMYIVILGGGGYYAYKDKFTKPYASQIGVAYTSNNNDKAPYSGILTDFGNKSLEAFVIDTHFLGLKTTLTFISDIEEVVFTKVSDETDMTYINQCFGELSIIEKGLKKYDGAYELESVRMGPGFIAVGHNPIYVFLNIDFVEKKIIIYTMNSDERIEQRIEKNIAITKTDGNWVIEIENEHNKGEIINLSFDKGHIIEFHEAFFDAYVMRFKPIGDLTEEEIQKRINKAIADYD